jgi:hypothetical protein
MEVVMSNLAHNLAVKAENFANVEQITNVETAESASEKVVQFLAQSKIIAQEANDACHIEGNLNSPDFDVFEAKYGFSFA